MNSAETGNLLFLHPEDPTKSFTFPFDKEVEDSLKLSELFKMITDQKQHYFQFEDAFGRRLLDYNVLHDMRTSQPFYITQMIPKTITFNITLPLGDQISISMDPAEMPAKIIEHIENVKDIPRDQQKLFFQGKQLDNNRSLMSQGIKQATVELTLGLKNTIHVLWAEGTFDVYADPEQPISFVQNKIQEKIDIPPIQQILKVGEKEAFVHETMEFLKLFNDATINLDLKVYTTFQFEDKTVKEFILPTLKINQVKEKFASTIKGNKITLPKECYDFEHQSHVLDNEKTLRELGFEKQVEFQVKLKDDVICVKLSRTTTLTELYLPKSNTVEDLIKMIKIDLGYDPERTKVFAGEEELKNEIILSTLDLTENKLELRIETNTLYKLFVVTLTGKTIELEIDVINTVEKLKMEVFRIEHIPIDEQRLIYAGKQLEDAKPLIDYNIPANSTINLVLRLRGGGSAPGFAFADITQPMDATDLDWDDEAPEWRCVTMNGLSLEGICLNMECVACFRWVIISKGIGTYDIVSDQHKNRCPMCAKYVRAEKCAFNNCYYGYTGIKLLEDEPLQKVTSQVEMRVGDTYKLFDPKFVGKANWLTLKIVTKALKEEDWEREDEEEEVVTAMACGICRKEVGEEKKTLECAHFYHPECLEKISGLDVKCAFCHF